MNNFWTQKPEVLLNNWMEIIPNKEMTRIERLNAIARYSILVGLLLYYIYNDTNYLWIGIGGLLLTVFMSKEKESFEANVRQCRRPTRDNPFMNTPVTEFNTQHLDACDITNPEISDKVNEEYYKDVFQDVSDVYNRRNGERQFYSMPQRLDYADQRLFADWLYNDGGSCKTDPEKCYRYVYPIRGVNQ